MPIQTNRTRQLAAPNRSMQSQPALNQRTAHGGLLRRMQARHSQQVVLDKLIKIVLVPTPQPALIKTCRGRTRRVGPSKARLSKNRQGNIRPRAVLKLALALLLR